MVRGASTSFLEEQRGRGTYVFRPTFMAIIVGERHMAAVRYIVNDVDEAVSFYRDLLNFTVEMHNPSKFAALSRGDLRLFINAPGAGSAGTAGGDPQPGEIGRAWGRERGC